MTQHKTRKFSPRGTSEAEIDSLISAPLIAASNANSAMAREQAKFLMEFCFQKDGDSYTPVMIEMHLHQGVLEPGESKDDPHNIRRISTTFQLPLITMIPINSLAVETVDVEFDLEISSQHQYDDEENDKKDTESKLHGSGSGAKLRGKISYDSKENIHQSTSNKYRSQNSSKLKVNIHAGQLPLPVGVNMMIDLYSKAVHPTVQNNNKKKNKT